MYNATMYTTAVYISLHITVKQRYKFRSSVHTSQWWKYRTVYILQRYIFSAVVSNFCHPQPLAVLVATRNEEDNLQHRGGNKRWMSSLTLPATCPHHHHAVLSCVMLLRVEMGLDETTMGSFSAFFPSFSCILFISPSSSFLSPHYPVSHSPFSFSLF